MKKAFSIALDEDTIEQLAVLQKRYKLPDRNSTIIFAINGAFYELSRDRRTAERSN